MIFKKIILIVLFFTVLAVGPALADVAVYPVPWVPDSGNPAKNGDSTGIKFVGVPQGAEISIYTVSGQLVWRCINNFSGVSTSVLADIMGRG